jgi:hypothetical protein
LILVLLPVAGCSVGGSAKPAPVPTIRTEGQDVRCAGGDHGIDEVQFGWSWCYPATWKFQERLQPTACNAQTDANGLTTQVCTLPHGVDSTFGIVNNLPAGQAGSGDFGFLIVGTYEIGSATNLADWVTADIGPGLTLTTISWGNSKEAVLDSQGRRFALTKSHVVEMDVRGDAISAEMAKRLDTWKFD